MTIKTDELRTTLIDQLASPAELAEQIPMNDDDADFIMQSRHHIENIIQGKDKRLLVIIGPCSIHDTEAAIDYAKKLKVLHDKYIDDLYIVMRVYFEKPRTTVGWKGLISDPDLDKSFNVAKGLNLARNLLLDINKMKLPAGTEFLDMVTGQYISDLISWGAIGARTTESQVHRELASALSCPVGFKNGTDGNVKIAIDAIKASSVPHVLYSPDKSGNMCIYQTHGNPHAHVILRGGVEPNYQQEHVEKACAALKEASFTPSVMIDCSHGNSRKDHKNQIEVAKDIANQLTNDEENIFGVMVESFLVEGNQGTDNLASLTYGQSITDACINLEESEKLLDILATALASNK